MDIASVSRVVGWLRGGSTPVDVNVLPPRARTKARRARGRKSRSKRRSDHYDRAAYGQAWAVTHRLGASQTRQFLASRTRRELLGSGVLGVRGRARSCALFGTRPTHPVCVLCVGGPARARRVCSTLHPYIILPFSSSTASSQGEASRSRDLRFGVCSEGDRRTLRRTNQAPNTSTLASFRTPTGDLGADTDAPRPCTCAF